MGVTKPIANRTAWKGRPQRVTVPYAKGEGPRREAYQSSTELVELRAKPGGPPPKAKYSSMTDSESVGRSNDEKYGDEPCETVPETVHLQAVGALCPVRGMGDGVPFA